MYNLSAKEITLYLSQIQQSLEVLYIRNQGFEVSINHYIKTNSVWKFGILFENQKKKKIIPLSHDNGFA